MKMIAALRAALACLWFSVAESAPMGVSMFRKRDLFLKAHGYKKGDLFLKTDDYGPISQRPGLRPDPTSIATSSNRRELSCGVTKQAIAGTDKWEDCPASCPFFAQNRKDDAYCTFVCVPGEECGKWNPNKPIPDTIKNSKTCRGPRVSFCTKPDLAGVDTCQKDGCQTGFKQWDQDGQCYFQHWTELIICVSIVVILFTMVLVWCIDFCCCRERINVEEFEKAQAFRSRSKVMQPRTATTPRCTYPLNTNLCRTDVAGPGMVLHFNFQAALIIWPLVIALIWTILACFYNELFIIGTRKFGTPRHNCVLVAWGYETQHRLMWTKVLFLAIVYVFSFVYFMLFSVRQHRIFRRLDWAEKTMKDFCIELKGLPGLPADASVEQDLQVAVQDALNDFSPRKIKILGVSIAWVYNDVQDAVTKACREDLMEREQQLNRNPERVIQDVPDPTLKMGPLRKKLYQIERSILADPPDDEAEDIVEILKKLKSSEIAYIVFNTEEEKDMALEAFQAKYGRRGGFKYDASKYGIGKEATLTLEEVQCEPATINWQNFGDSSTAAFVRRFMWGFCFVYLPALFVWFFAFYVPYAYSLYNFNYDNGAELPVFYSVVFTMVVVGGNATMYVVCDICCDVIGFRYKDTKQITYMLMYLFACMFNVFLDMVVTYYTALKIVVGLDFRTYDGTRIAEIDTWTEQFETYAMQRSLAENVFQYSFPSTFLVPFLLEPFITVLIPYQIGKIIILTHSEIKGATAEAYLQAFEFDLGRYADILLNVFLGILIFYFPGGYTWSLFYGMFFSHIVIYLFDHWRVLNVIPSVKIVSMVVEWWAQVMLAACCAMIMMVLVFKANCEAYAGYCLQDMRLVQTCTIAGVIHFIVHMIMLVYLVPCLGHENNVDANEGMTYKEVAKEEANTWFSVNPIHCLRSKYIHKDSPHCHLASWGKEHLLEVNEKIHCYFSDEAASLESYDTIDALKKSFSGKSL